MDRKELLSRYLKTNEVTLLLDHNQIASDVLRKTFKKIAQDRLKGKLSLEEFQLIIFNLYDNGYRQSGFDWTNEEFPEEVVEALETFTDHKMGHPGAPPQPFTQGRQKEILKKALKSLTNKLSWG